MNSVNYIKLTRPINRENITSEYVTSLCLFLPRTSLYRSMLLFSFHFMNWLLLPLLLLLSKTFAGMSKCLTTHHIVSLVNSDSKAIISHLPAENSSVIPPFFVALFGCITLFYLKSNLIPTGKGITDSFGLLCESWIGKIRAMVK